MAQSLLTVHWFKCSLSAVCVW